MRQFPTPLLTWGEKKSLAKVMSNDQNDISKDYI